MELHEEDHKRSQRTSGFVRLSSDQGYVIVIEESMMSAMHTVSCSVAVLQVRSCEIAWLDQHVSGCVEFIVCRSAPDY
jgi:hypothetical protein